MTEYLSPEGLKKIKEELQILKTEKRKKIADKLSESIAQGDLSENSEYFEAKEEQAFLEGKISELEKKIRDAVIVSNNKRNKGWVQIGSTILVSTDSKKLKFQIVGAEESDPIKGKISVNSPLGKAILNKPKGAVIKTSTPRGEIKYKILKII
jgi:transcription elongation factor GreA